MNMPRHPNLTINTVASHIRTLRFAAENAVKALEADERFSECPGHFLSALGVCELYASAFCRTFDAPELMTAIKTLASLAENYSAAVHRETKIPIILAVLEHIPVMERATAAFVPRESPVYDRSCLIHR